jgi:predicted amidohydrolase YtcJ
MLEATLAVLNANVITLNSKQPRVEAIAVHDQKIVAVGSSKEVRGYVGSKTRVVDGKRKTIIPGLVDCHVHMADFGLSLQNLDLRGIKSIKEMQRRLRQYAGKNREKPWILGGRWDQDRFAEKRYPTCRDLDAVVSDKPTFLIRVCGHIGVANSKAMHLAGITKQTVVDGGEIDLDEVIGQPTGIIRENALRLVWKTIPKPGSKEIERACKAACEKAVEAGLTGVHWMVSFADEVRALQRLNSGGKLPLRVYLGIPVELLDELVNLGLLTGFGNDMVKIGFVKILADGSLGARTAALKEPYTDKPETCGMMLYSQTMLNRLILKAHKAGLQLAVHAIGDLAIDSVLKAFEKALRDSPRKGHRHRIEHCSVLNPKLIKRMKHLGIVASVQPHFVVSDFWVVDRVGKKRARWVYCFKTLRDEGLVVASGSDCPVEKISPLLGIWAAVERKDFPEKGMAVKDALETYTVNAAYASFDEDRKGTIEPGKLADFVILSDDLFEAQPNEIKRVTVEMTVVDGRVVYASKRFQNGS